MPVRGAHLSASCIAIGTVVGSQGSVCSAGADTASFLGGVRTESRCALAMSVVAMGMVVADLG